MFQNFLDIYDILQLKSTSKFFYNLYKQNKIDIRNLALSLGLNCWGCGLSFSSKTKLDKHLKFHKHNINLQELRPDIYYDLSEFRYTRFVSVSDKKFLSIERTSENFFYDLSNIILAGFITPYGYIFFSYMNDWKLLCKPEIGYYLYNNRIIDRKYIFHIKGTYWLRMNGYIIPVLKTNICRKRL